MSRDRQGASRSYQSFRSAGLPTSPSDRVPTPPLWRAMDDRGARPIGDCQNGSWIRFVPQTEAGWNRQSFGKLPGIPFRFVSLRRKRPLSRSKFLRIARILAGRSNRRAPRFNGREGEKQKRRTVSFRSELAVKIGRPIHHKARKDTKTAQRKRYGESAISLCDLCVLRGLVVNQVSIGSSRMGLVPLQSKSTRVRSGGIR